MKHSHLHVPLLIAALSILLFVIALSGYMHYEVGNMTAKARDARVILANQESDTQKDLSVREVFDESSADRAKLPTYFISDAKPVAFIESIEGLGKDAGSALTFSGLAADDLSSSPLNTVGTVRASIDATGSWNAVMKTLTLAETLPYIARIHDVRLDTSISPLGTKADKRQWHISFGIDAGLIHAAKSSAVTTQP